MERKSQTSSNSTPSLNFSACNAREVTRRDSHVDRICQLGFAGSVLPLRVCRTPGVTHVAQASRLRECIQPSDCTKSRQGTNYGSWLQALAPKDRFTRPLAELPANRPATQQGACAWIQYVAILLSQDSNCNDCHSTALKNLGHSSHESSRQLSTY